MLHLFLPILLAVSAHAEESMHSRVVDMLSGMESVPSAAQWLALGPAAEAELEAIAADASMLPTQRGNALVALANFPTERALALLLATAENAEENTLLRRKAIGALGQGWGAGALPALSAALGQADAQVRVAAVRALAALPGEAAVGVLRAHLAKEADATVLAELHKVVSP
jgi:HEAT repeat protein